jgi:multiple sugar transport system ATP-binding protein
MGRSDQKKGTQSRRQEAFGEVEVIPPLDLTIEDGEFVVFVGPSGCGKSTLLRLIAGLEDVTDGEIRSTARTRPWCRPPARPCHGVPVLRALPAHERAQEHRLPVRMAKLDPGRAERRVEAAAEVLNLTDYLDRRPGQLSGGQRQRVAIGRAIVREPRRSSSTSPCRTSTRRCASACGWKSPNCTSGWPRR